MRLRTAYVLAVVCALLLTANSAYATDVAVNCGAKKSNSIQAALDSLSKQGPHTVTVSGTCTEAVLIDGFDSLTLLGTPGASINDPTLSVADDNDVIDIVNSRSVRVEGLTINGGLFGIACFAFSACQLNNNTIQGTSDFAVLIGRQSTAQLIGCTIQNSAGGLQLGFGGAQAVVFGGTIQNITSPTDPDDPGFLGYPAVSVELGANLRFSPNGPGNRVMIQNNTFDGISASTNSTVVMAGNAVTIDNSGGNGVSVDRGSVLELRNGNQVNNSAGIGVRVGESSFAFVGGNASFSNNGGGDLTCAGTFSNAKGKLPCNNP